MTLALLAFAGVAMPFMIQLYQNRSARLDREFLEALLKTKLKEAQNELESSLSTLMADEIQKAANLTKQQVAEAVAPLERKVADALGGVYHVQAVNLKCGAVALRSCCDAIPFYFEAQNEYDLQTVLRIVTDDCLPNLNKTDFEESESTEERVNSLTKTLASHNEYGRYSRVIDEIKKGLQESKRREKPA
jgi:hypothetical protein